jgi:hypothetical protein
MKTNTIRYKVAKNIYKMQNSNFAESIREFDYNHPKAIPAIGCIMVCIATILTILLIVG